jgi:hypothetical protein
MSECSCVCLEFWRPSVISNQQFPTQMCLQEMYGAAGVEYKPEAEAQVGGGGTGLVTLISEDDPRAKNLEGQRGAFRVPGLENPNARRGLPRP